jgi:hypothetical protein
MGVNRATHVEHPLWDESVSNQLHRVLGSHYTLRVPRDWRKLSLSVELKCK